MRNIILITVLSPLIVSFIFAQEINDSSGENKQQKPISIHLYSGLVSPYILHNFYNHKEASGFPLMSMLLL